MTERKWAPIDTEAQLDVISHQVAEMPDDELAGVKARIDAESAKRQPAGKQIDFGRMTDAELLEFKIRNGFANNGQVR